MDKNLTRKFFENELNGSINNMVYYEITRCFIGSLIKRGCKKRAKKIFYGVLELLKFRINEHPLIVLEKILYTVSPKLSLTIKKRGGSSYKLPHLISYKRSLSKLFIVLLKLVNFALKIIYLNVIL
jgi:ribosomal protein S7